MPTGSTRSRADRTTRWWLIGTAAVVVAAAVGLGLAVAGSGPDTTPREPAGSPTSADGGIQGQPLPDLTYTRFRTDATQQLAAYRDGRPLVINVFASWCAPCLAELPRFEQAHQAHQDRVAFLGVNLQDSRRAAQQVIADTGISYPVAIDPNGRIFQALDGVGMPTTVFVDADGIVRERYTGELSADQLAAKLDGHGMLTSDT